MVFVDSDLLIKCLQPKNHPIHIQARAVLSWLFEKNQVVKTTVYNYAELFRGVYLSDRVAYNLGLVEKFLSRFEIVLPTFESMREYAQISANLRLKGENVGDIDELIASIIISTEEPFYSRNIEHFEKIPLIHLINWEDFSIEK